MTPDLIEVLEKLKKEHLTVVQKDPAVKYKFKEEVSDELDLDPEKDWLDTYDRKLDVIKQHL